MKCPKCGFEESDSSKFCTGCGAPLSVVTEAKKETVETAKAEVKSDGAATDRFMPNNGSAVNLSDNKATAAETVTAVAASNASEKKIDKKAAKIAENEAKKQAKADAKQNAKDQKALEKKEKEQNLLDSCPKCYKPVSTGVYFWLMLINAIPLIGLIFSFFASLITPNRNIKRFEKAACMWLLILTLIAGAVILFGIFYFGDDNIFDIMYDLGDALGF
ncbi:MAG: zinc ribbon domain-containing protein [Clostridia bacterium]|nr:zinc ribbon domain-containing protein [Clostridia bacterium]